jgi:hypothetical protein
MKIDYRKAYNIYKILPLINACVILLCCTVWGILDGILCISELAYDLEFLAFFIWLLIGCVAAGITFLASVITISPVITRTDAAIAIQNVATGNANNSTANVDELPEL